MQPFGTDRVRRGNGEQWVILSLRSKGWVPRTPATATRRDRPGTAVRCDEKYYEVVAATATAGGIRYVLEPWREEHIMRVVDSYDEASEARRSADHHDVVGRERGRLSANLLGVLTGQLPGPVQERMGNELGIWPARLTIVSIIPAMIFILLVLNLHVQRRLEMEAPLPSWAMMLAGYLLLESGIRFFVAMTQNRPLGSLAGFLGYTVFYLVAPNRKQLIRPVEEASKWMPVADVSEEVALQDRCDLLEPLLTLLTPAEQHRLTERFRLDHRRMAHTVAGIILSFSVLGLATSAVSLAEGVRLSPMLSFVVCAGLSAEQIARLWSLRRGPAGSVLGVLVRPLARKLLAAGVERASHG